MVSVLRWEESDQHSAFKSVVSRLFILVALFFVLLGRSEARFASSAQVASGVEFNDNIFFTADDKEQDAIFFINPTLSFFYEPTRDGPHTLRAGISSPVQIYSRNTSETNFGDNILVTAKYEYKHSPRLALSLQNDFRRAGSTRTGISQVTSGAEAPPGVVLTGDADLIRTGEFLSNVFLATARYNYNRGTTFSGSFVDRNDIFLDAGGTTSHRAIAFFSSHRLNDKFSLRSGYAASFIRSGGDDEIVHEVPIGVAYRNEVVPTLTVSFDTGLGFVQNASGPTVVNSLNLRLSKIWKTALAEFGVSRGLTGSLGVAGISTTTSVLSRFSVRLTRQLTAFADGKVDFFDTDEVDFNTVAAQIGLQYQINSWLSSSFRYLYRQRDAGSGAADTDLGTSGKIASNRILLSFTTEFDLWPNPGLAKGAGLASEERAK